MARVNIAMSLVELFVKLLHQAVSPLLPVMALIFAQQGSLVQAEPLLSQAVRSA